MGRWVFLVALVGCAGPVEEEAFVDHDTPLDLVELTTKSGISGLPDSFDRNRVMGDAFFTSKDSVDAAKVQRFLERNPYGRRSFLADVQVGGESAAAAIVRGARSEGINPIVMLARMQVEKSLVAKTSNPGGGSVDYAFGCGCPDGRACNPVYRGLDKQIACAARTLRRHFDASAAGGGIWTKGTTKSTLDPIRVTPANHATASLYAYTPWVLQGRGGNWLVWNVTKRFADHFASLGVDLPRDDPNAAPESTTWIGTPCEADEGCDFGHLGTGSCQLYPGGGVCTLSCEGLCPDKAGAAPTFCVSASHFGEREDFGVCTVRPAASNRGCLDIPGMKVTRVERFRGGSNAERASVEACVPANVEAPRPPVEQPPREEPPVEEPPPADEPPRDPPPADQPPRDDPPPAEEPPAAERPPVGLWVGDVCVDDAGCGFIADGRRGRCFREHRPANGRGFCVLDCAGVCPDRDGRAPTFCAPVRALGGAGERGACVEQSDGLNRFCADRAGMRELGVSRFVGQSGAQRRDAVVCAPDIAVAPPPADGGACGIAELETSDHGDSCAGVPNETWRCACSGRFETTVSQVCRSGQWVNYELDIRDCGGCNGRYSSACEDR